MRALPVAHRNILRTAVLDARRASETACRTAIDALGVFADKRPDHLDAQQSALRNGLRAKWRQLDLDRELLVAECAYEQWHRLLFARFLAENELLLHPRYEAPVTLADCEDLAAELGEPDAWSVAARFASEILPGIFRLDDPCVRLRLAPEGRHALEQILGDLSSELFAADDALGWVYQYWQKDKKDEINASERKIGVADLGPVTQLFTENYMVRFLLENSLGAWWAARHPDSPLVKGFDYLRFGEDGKPAGGSFDRWPERVAEVTVMDPCCGSGHFLVEAFSMLWQMRVEEEGLPLVEAQDSVLRDNLFGLELDSRCVQIAMFNLVMHAWKVGAGWRRLPVPNIACSGIRVEASTKEWTAFANGDEQVEGALARLHRILQDSNMLGSIIDPRSEVEQPGPAGRQTSIEDVDWERLAPLVEAAAALERPDDTVAVLGANLVALVRAAEFLSRSFTLSVTNPPFLTGGYQPDALRHFSSERYPSAAKELAIVMAQRFLRVSKSCAFVLPQHWMYTGAFRKLRNDWLINLRWQFMARLGPGAFSSISGEIVQVVLCCASKEVGHEDSEYLAIDAQAARGATGKAAELISAGSLALTASLQMQNPDARILFSRPGKTAVRLGELVFSTCGMNTKDQARFVLHWWEPEQQNSDWEFLQETASETAHWSGLTRAVYWQRGEGVLKELQRVGKAILVGSRVYGRPGVLMSLTGEMRATLYHGGHFSQNAAALCPTDPALLPALWEFVTSSEFGAAVRELDVSLKVPPGTLVKVPFKLDQWQSIAADRDPLPALASGDPTQWIFQGLPATSSDPLQVSIGRLLGFKWPYQVKPDNLATFEDEDGIVCIPAVAGEARAADRAQQLLATAYGDTWSPAKLKELLEQSGGKKANLADWLQDEFFKQHCALFGNRPFVWHIWDGLKDGFSALVNYHLLDRKTLAKLTYTYLGQDWVERQRAEIRDEVAGAEARLTAALELKRRLELILDGEQPYDIYVRWKAPHEQPIGWEPDLNNGVRLNIRPFVTAGVLRAPFNIHWKKDRGKDPDGSERHNDIHISLAEKQDARKRAGRHE